MTSSPADDSVPLEPPLSVVAGWQSVLPVPARPIEAWLDLMEVVEALCPEWPEAPPPVRADYRL